MQQQKQLQHEMNAKQIFSPGWAGAGAGAGAMLIA